MANENANIMANKQYFLLIYLKNDPMPNIISADIIAEIYADNKAMDIVTTNDASCHFDDVESFKMVPVEEINFSM